MKPVLIIQNVAIESPGSVLDYIREKGLPHRLVRSFDGDAFPKLDDISAIVNLGCPISVTQYSEHEYLVRLFNYISEAARVDKPYLGICYGGQLLAHVLGARVEPNKMKEIGTYTVRLTSAGKADPLFEGLAETIPVFHWHGDTFRIPMGAELLVEGDDCKNQAFRLGRMAAVQFHFEALSSEITAWCDAYADEMNELGKTTEQIVDEYESIETQVRANNYRFLDNFFKLSGL